MFGFGLAIFALAMAGVVCGVVSILDAFGAIDLDAPESKPEGKNRELDMISHEEYKRRYKTYDYTKKGSEK